MSAKDTITSALELLAVVLLMMGLVYNEQLIEMEDRLWGATKRALKRVLRYIINRPKYGGKTETVPVANVLPDGTEEESPCPTPKTKSTK